MNPTYVGEIFGPRLDAHQLTFVIHHLTVDCRLKMSINLMIPHSITESTVLLVSHILASSALR